MSTVLIVMLSYLDLRYYLPTCTKPQVNPSSMQVYASPKYKYNYFPESFIHIHIKHLLKYLKHNFPKDLHTFPSGSVNISMG